MFIFINKMPREVNTLANKGLWTSYYNSYTQYQNQ